MEVATRRRDILVWYFLKKFNKRRFVHRRYGTRESFVRRLAKRRSEFLQAILSCVNIPRCRALWMCQRSMVWFDMVEECFTNAQWYENFRVRRETFVYLLNEISQDITHQDTIMRKSIPAKRRFALTLYYLASTAEYRTLGNLFGVSVSFVCICIKDVCEAIRNRLSKVIRFPKGEELLQVIQNYEDK